MQSIWFAGEIFSTHVHNIPSHPGLFLSAGPEFLNRGEVFNKNFPEVAPQKNVSACFSPNYYTTSVPSLKGGPEPSNFENLCLVNVSVKYFSKLCFGTIKIQPELKYLKTILEVFTS